MPIGLGEAVFRERNVSTLLGEERRKGFLELSAYGWRVYRGGIGMLFSGLGV